MGLTLLPFFPLQSNEGLLRSKKAADPFLCISEAPATCTRSRGN